jgi:hypothetical protein
MSLVQIIYVSRCAARDRASQARHWAQIAPIAAHRNAAHDITGCLIAGASHFIQILEGPTPAAEILFARISRDMRHSSLTSLGHRAIRNRSFARWSNVCLATDMTATGTLARHGLTAAFEPCDLSMPTVLALAMDIADATRMAEITAPQRRCPGAEMIATLMLDGAAGNMASMQAARDPRSLCP